jgi:Holliday junction resolvase RusA-like endonuclease
MDHTDEDSGNASFDYVVYGRPVSAQPMSRGSRKRLRKSPRLPEWRRAISAAVEQAWETYSKDVFIDLLRLDLFWVYDTRLPNDPDLDNIIKPFIDALEGLLYAGDEMFREMHLSKFALLEPRTIEGVTEKLRAALASQREFVYVRVSMIGSGRIRTLKFAR